MPFVDQSTLTYPATNSFPVRKWLDTRDPVSGANGDYRSFRIFDVWINESTPTAWIMVNRTSTSGTWLQMSSSGTGILTITGDSGGAVAADGANNINILTSGNLTITGVPASNTLTISLDGTVADTYTTDSGNAIPSSGILNVLGTGGITTSGAGSTVTITGGATIPTSFVTDAGTATPALNILNVLGGTGANTAGAGDTVTVNVDDSVATTYTSDSGVATPSSNNLNILGTSGLTTTGSGATITVTSDGTLATSYVTDSGTATPAANTLNIVGGSGIDTSGATDTVTIVADATVPTTFTADSGTAIPSGNNLNIVGINGITTSAASSTVTIDGSGSGGGGAWQFIETKVGSTSVELEFTDLDGCYMFVFQRIIPDATSVFQAQVSDDNGSTYLNSGYWVRSNAYIPSSTTPSFFLSGPTSTRVPYNDTMGYNGILYAHCFNDSSYIGFWGNAVWANPTTFIPFQQSMAGASHINTPTLNAIRFFFTYTAVDNISSGQISMYKLVTS